MSIRLFVGNIPHKLDEAGLAEAFSGAGVTIVNPKILRDRETGASRGFGFVEIPEGQVLPQTETIMIMGRTLRIEMAQSQASDRRPVAVPSSRSRRPDDSPRPAAFVADRGRRGKPERPGRGRNRRDDFGGGW